MSDDFSWDDEVHERIRLAVAGGYDPADRIVEDVTEVIEYDPAAEDYVATIDGSFGDHVRRLVDQALAAHQADEAGYPPVTDCDRITEVFAQLTASGILAAEDVGMTMSDLRYDMWEWLEQKTSVGAAPRGWAAFHRQDVDRAVDTGSLFIAYAAATDLDEDFVVIAGEVADALAAAGFDVTWDGTANQRIELRGLAWQRRRTV